MLLRNAKGQFSKINVNQRTLFPERVTSLLLSIRTGSLECVQLLMDHPGLSLEDNYRYIQLLKCLMLNTMPF